MSSRRRACAAALAASVLPGDAAAHSPIAGIDGFYAGLLHPFTSPAQILALVALGFLLGQRRPRQFAIAWLVFAAAGLIGILVGQAGLPPGEVEPGLLGLALLAGVLAALWPGGPALPVLASAAVGGALIGIASTPDPGPLRATILTLAGSFAGAVLALVYAVGGVAWLQDRTSHPWIRVGLRAAAAWVAAIAALLLALSLHYPANSTPVALRDAPRVEAR